MPIKFHCPTPTCGKVLTVSDEAAGRSGKCPGCGNRLVVPLPEPAPDEGFEVLEPEPVAKAKAEPEPAPRPKSRPGSGVPLEPVSTERSADPDWGAVGARGPAGPVVSFDAVGLAWGLLKGRMGTWILAVIVLGFAQGLCQVILTFASGLAAAAEFAVIGNPFPLSPLAIMFFGVMVQAVLFGGLYKMALKQVDGGEIQLGDVFAVGSVAPGLAVAGLLTGLGTAIGFLFLFVPGLLFAALAIFTTPAVVDGLGAFEALKSSVGTLKRQWFTAIVFVLVMWMILMSGLLLLGFGMLITLPLYVLAATVQYRRSFAPGGVPRKVVVADPWAEAVGEPAGATGSGRVPGWAWGLLGLGMAMPVLFVALLAALVIPAARHAAQQVAARDEMRKAMAGFPDEARDEVALREPLQPPAAVRVRPPGKDEIALREPFQPPAAVRVRPPGKELREVFAPPREKKDRLQQALDLTKNGGPSRSQGLNQLAHLPTDDRHRADVVAAAAALLREPVLGVDAAEALGHWAGPADVPKLVAGLDSDQAPARIYLIRGLGRLKAEAAIPVLVQHVAVADDRREAARALRFIGPKAIPEVRKLLASDDGNTRREAVNLLRVIGRDDPGTLRDVTLAAVKGTDNVERDRALHALAQTPAIGDLRGEVLAATLPLLQSPEASLRRSAAKVVEAWGTDEQAPALIAVLNDPDREVKRSAIAALAKMPDRQSALGVARLLTTPEVRREAADGLKAMNVRDKEVEAEVRKALGSPDPGAREAACQVLGVVGTEASVPALKRLSADRSRNVANAARAALSTIDAPTKSKGMVRKRR